MTIVLRIAAIIASLSMLAAMPTQAQVAGSRLTKYAEKADAGRVFKLWVECVAGLETKWARGVLETLPSTEAEAKYVERRVGEDDRCLYDSRLVMSDRQLGFSFENMRGGLARYFVKFAPAGQSATNGAATAWLRDALASLPAGQTYDKASLVAYQFAACLADNYWAEAHAYVVAEPGASEKSALAALSPKFEYCLAPGAKLDLTVAILRVYLAEAVYHGLTYAPKVAPPTIPGIQGAAK